MIFGQIFESESSPTSHNNSHTHSLTHAHKHKMIIRNTHTKSYAHKILDRQIIDGLSTFYKLRMKLEISMFQLQVYKRGKVQHSLHMTINLLKTYLFKNSIYRKRKILKPTFINANPRLKQTR